MSVLVALLICSPCLAGPGEPSLRIQPSKEVTRVEVIGSLAHDTVASLGARITQERGESRLRFVLVENGTKEASASVLGRYEVRDKTLVFTPRYPLVHGQLYRATLTLRDGKTVTADYRVPGRPPTPPAIVERIYPSAAVLPANNLKFYIHFSKPMRESRDIFEHFQLLDAKGQPVEDPWRRTELWTADGKRLTLYAHPGRVKRGVNLREEMGPLMEPDRPYRLVISAELVDAEGQALGKSFTKTFRTSEEERRRVEVRGWKLRAPPVECTSPVLIDFPRPLDRAQLERYVTVVDANDIRVKGRIEVGRDERRWSFHPTEPWRNAEYRVIIDENLEDLAGNTPARVFDTDLDEIQGGPPKLTLSFRPRVP